LNLVSIQEAAKVIRDGGVVAYPTESCYGLGCDPDNHVAVNRILKIKRRKRSKGLILISDHISRIRHYLANIPNEREQEILESWPGPNTWLLPARPAVSSWLRGNHQSIAVRITQHPGTRLLCREAGMALVSTSANRSGQTILKTAARVSQLFHDEVDCIVQGQIGTASAPSVIRDAVSGATIRN
jgi:L-threonylcarbamoyladenylate synthase